jgi:hypothetical protein
MHRLDVAELTRRYHAGETVVGIARDIGASQSGVYRAIKRSGIERSP